MYSDSTAPGNSMHISRIRVPNFRALKNIDISFEEDFEPRFFPLASINGGGKSTLLQLIFIVLHCSSSKKNVNCIKNILSLISIEEKHENYNVFSIELKDESKKIDLDFLLIPSKKYFDALNQWSQEEELGFDIESFESSIIDFDFENHIDKTNKNPTHKIDSTLRNLEEHEFYLKDFDASEDTRTVLDEKKLAEIAFSLDEQEQSSPRRFPYYKYSTIRELRAKINDLRDKYQAIKENYKTTTIIDRYTQFKKEFLITSVLVGDLDEYALVCRSLDLKKENINIREYLERVSQRVYLISAHSHVFLFTDKKTRSTLFLDPKNTRNGYFSELKDSTAYIPNLYMHDFIPVEGLLKSFKLSKDKDFEKAVETDGSEYGDNYNKLLRELDEILPTKKVRPNRDLTEINFKLQGEDEATLYPEDLSHGELRKLGLYLWMKNNNIHNSIILIDELEIGLHPDWQYQIVNDLIEHFSDNQYIVATHSYDICEAVTPAHVKELSPEFKLKTAQ